MITPPSPKSYHLRYCDDCRHYTLTQECLQCHGPGASVHATVLAVLPAVSRGRGVITTVQEAFAPTTG